MRLLPFILGCVLGEGTSPVSVSLDSSWNSSPLYIEAIEFVNTLKNERTLEKFIRIIAGTKGKILKSLFYCSYFLRQFFYAKIRSMIKILLPLKIFFLKFQNFYFINLFFEISEFLFYKFYFLNL